MVIIEIKLKPRLISFLEKHLLLFYASSEVTLLSNTSMVVHLHDMGSPYTFDADCINLKEIVMSHKGKVQITIVFTATPDMVEEGDRLWASHAAWMEASHYREGDKALLRYNLSKGEELSNPIDPSSSPTGNTVYVLTEVYETQAGVEDHWKQGSEDWKDFNALLAWAGNCNVTALPIGGPVIHSLW